MAEPKADKPAKTRPALWRPAAMVAMEATAVACLVVIGGGYFAYQNRRDIARDVAESWLRSHGVDGEIRVDRIDATGFSGAIRLGPKNNPDLVADRIDVDYGLSAPWMGSPFALHARSIRLVHPRARLAFDGKRLTYGSLDPLVRDLLSRPKTGEPAPDIRIERGEVSLASPYGHVRITQAEATMAEGRLTRVDARLLPTSLKSGASIAALSGGRLQAVGDGGALTGGVSLSASSLQAPGTRLGPATLTLDLAGLRYDLKEGVVVLTATGRIRLASDVLKTTAAAIAAPAVDLALPRIEVNVGKGIGGRFSADGVVSARAVKAGDVSVQALASKVRLADARWSFLDGKGQIASPIVLDLNAGGAPVRLAGAAMRASAIQAHFEGRLDTAERNPVQGQGRASARGAFDAADAAKLAAKAPILGKEPAYAEALTKALRDFTVTAPGFRLTLGEGGPNLRLDAPARIASASGATLAVDPKGLALGQSMGGAFTLALSGGGLPKVDLSVSDLSGRSAATDAQVRLETQLDFGPAKAAHIKTGGRAHLGGDGFTFTGQDCADLAADHLDLGETRIDHPSGQLCALKLTTKGKTWRLDGRAVGGKADAPSLNVTFDGVAGPLTVTGGQALAASITLNDAGVTDTAEPLRFNPVRAKGALTLVSDIWRGELDLRTPPGHTLGHVSLEQNPDGAGHADIDATRLVFAKGGLQPGDLTPAAVLIDDAVGPASFTGRLAWSKGVAVNGQGRLTTPGLDFVSPLGPVHQLKTDIALTSLFPLITAPNQSASTTLVDAFVPLADVRASFDLNDDILQLRGASAGAAGGRVSLEPTKLSLKGGAADGVIVLDDVDLGQLIALTSYADRIKANLVVDGRLPFGLDAKGGFTFKRGELATVRPGRLEISRQVLTGVETGAATVEGPTAITGAPEGASAVNAVQDVVYQAMENLAVDSLKATVESLPNGRLGALFSIKGQHDPAVAEKATISLGSLINKSAFNRRIPLPKGTPIDLTLDTSLNFDEVLKGVQSSFETFRKLRLQSHSAEVQRKGTSVGGKEP